MSGERSAAESWLVSEEVLAKRINERTLLAGRAGCHMVVGANLLLSSQLLTIEQVEDIANSVLLAELVAAKACDLWEDPDSWYRKRHETLGAIGWISQGGDWRRWPDPEEPVALSEAILDIAQAVHPADEAALISDILQELGDVEATDEGLMALSSESLAGRGGGFIMTFFGTTADTIWKRDTRVYFNAIDTETNILKRVVDAGSGDQLKYGVTESRLNQEIFMPVREKIREKLDERRRREERGG